MKEDNLKILQKEKEKLLEEIRILKEENQNLHSVYNEAVISENTFKNLFDTTSDAIYIQDKNGIFLMVNHGAEKMYDYPREYFIGKTPEFLSAPGMNDLSVVIKSLEKVFQGEDQRFEFWGITKSGRIFPKAVKMMKGIFKGEDVAIVTANDISEKKLASENIKKTTSTLKAIFEGSPDGIVIIEDNIVTLINERFTEITGLNLRDISTEKLESIIHEEDKNITKSKLKIAFKNNELPKEIIYRVKLKSGEEKILKNRYNFLGNDKNVNFRLVIVSDITKQKKSEEALLDSKFKLKGIFENSVDGIGLSKNGIHVMCNPAFLKIFGYDNLEEIQERTEINLIAPEEREKVLEYGNNRGNNLSIPRVYNTIGLRKDGSKFDLEIKVSDYELKNENYQIAVIRDVTESNRLTKELIEAKNNAEKADKLKSEFLAQISHEIRTPINAILSFASLIKEDIKEFIDEDISASFEILNQAGNRLVRTIDLILSMSELQTNSYEMTLKSINLNSEILLKIIESKLKIAKKKNIIFNTNFINDLNLLCDEHSVSQIFENLLDNAVKYTNSGKVEIITKTENNSKIVEIIDTGIGISDEYLQELFQPFSQEDQGYCRKFEGNGLGLALVKKYCDLNNAKISVHSEKGIGTKFKISF